MADQSNMPPITGRTVYKIVNPSDPYTIVADSHEVAALACLLLGDGSYAFTPVEGDMPEVPLFIFSGAVEWFEETFASGIGESIEKNALAVADCLDTVLIGRLSDRRTVEDALSRMPEPADRASFLAERHNRQRSSLNDIGKRAKALAGRMRKRLGAEQGGAP